MPIITLSRGSLTRGGEVAAEVARMLGYRCIAREVLLEASSMFNIPEARLIHAISGSLSILDRFTDGRRRYVAYIRAALLEELVQDDVVYHGFAGQFFVSGVAHALRVRVEADPEERVGIVMERDGVSADQARALIASNDLEREQWCLHLYGVGPRDPRLYEMVLQVGRLPAQAAAEIICQTARLAAFRSTPASQQHLEDLALAARVQCALAELTPDIEVIAARGAVTIKTLPQVAGSGASVRHIEQLAAAVGGVSTVRIDGCLNTGACSCGS